MYNGGAEIRGGFLARAFGLDRVVNRTLDLRMFEADLPSDHSLIREAREALGTATLNTAVRIGGVLVIAAAAASVAIR